MRKYTVAEFEKKYAGKRHISCGVHYKDGTHECIVNASFSQIISYIKNKEVLFIVSK